MLKDTLFRVPRATGLQLLHRRGEGDARELTSWRLRLHAGGVEHYAAPGEETVVVLQDGRDGEPVLEEVYHYRIDPPQGFGVQMLYSADGESITHAVRDGDAVLLPYGYHPVSAPPGYRLYYLWGMAGVERRLALHEDPQHSWITKA